jgi:adenylate cyclase
MRFNNIFSEVVKYRFRRVVYIAIFWTVIDLLVTVLSNTRVTPFVITVVTRAILVFPFSLFMGYLFVFTLKDILRDKPMLVNFLMKSLIVLIAALFMNFLIQFIEKKFIEGLNFNYLVHHFSDGKWDLKWFLRRTLYWIVLFIITQLYLEVNNKYSPGVFIDVLRGKYLTPKVENRIVMFMDLKDSTTIAEKLGHQQYFLFIRDFINYVSTALIEYNGIIYQYVGDEVVVSWADNKKNIKNSLNAVIESRKNIQKKSNSFKRRFGIIPEFRVGIHVGEVTVGEIGVIKKDLAMSGDTMNTTARIRSACNELNEKFIVSKDFVDKSDLTDWQAKSLGRVELKGKMSDIELFSLKI